MISVFHVPVVCLFVSFGKMSIRSSAHFGGFPGGSVVKNPPAVQEIQIPCLGQKDPLEKEMATHSSILT